EICGAREPQAALPRRAPRPLPGRRAVAGALVAPARRLDDLVDALPEANGRHRQVVRRLGEGVRDDANPPGGRIEPELLGGLAEPQFGREAGLHRAVASLGAARRVVGEDARALELVDRDLVGDRIDHARVEGGRDAVGAVGTAVEPRPEMAARDIALSREA